MTPNIVNMVLKELMQLLQIHSSCDNVYTIWWPGQISAGMEVQSRKNPPSIIFKLLPLLI